MGQYPLIEHNVRIAGRDWRISAVRDQDQLIDAVTEESTLDRFPYGMLLWPSAIALAEWLAENAGEVRDRRILELGCGAGLPGIVARWLGAEVCQTDYLPETLELSKSNAAHNTVEGIERRILDWRNPNGLDGYDLVMGADVLYERSVHDDLQQVLELAVPTHGRAVITDPVRPRGIDFVDKLERSGWRVAMESRFVKAERQRIEIALFGLQRS